jgi:hypothetical protein
MNDLLKLSKSESKFTIELKIPQNDKF